MMAMQGQDLRRLRKAANLTQGQLAEALGLTPQYIGMMERGEKLIERRTEMAVHYVAVLASSNTMFAMARKCEAAAQGGPKLDQGDLEQIAEWLDRSASLPRDWSPAEKGGG